MFGLVNQFVFQMYTSLYITDHHCLWWTIPMFMNRRLLWCASALLGWLAVGAWTCHKRACQHTEKVLSLWGGPRAMGPNIKHHGSLGEIPQYPSIFWHLQNFQSFNDGPSPGKNNQKQLVWSTSGVKTNIFCEMFGLVNHFVFQMYTSLYITDHHCLWWTIPMFMNRRLLWCASALLGWLAVGAWTCHKRACQHTEKVLSLWGGSSSHGAKH